VEQILIAEMDGSCRKQKNRIRCLGECRRDSSREAARSSEMVSLVDDDEIERYGSSLE